MSFIHVSNLYDGNSKKADSFVLEFEMILHLNKKNQRFMHLFEKCCVATEPLLVEFVSLFSMSACVSCLESGTNSYCK